MFVCVRVCVCVASRGDNVGHDLKPKTLLVECSPLLTWPWYKRIKLSTADDRTPDIDGASRKACLGWFNTEAGAW